MSGDIVDPYAVLGLSRMATPDELKHAYRRLVKAWHPDRFASSPETQRLEADRRFKLINSAYVIVGEMLREKASVETAVAQGAAQRSDARIDAIRSVVASSALRIIPNLPRHTYRRVVSTVEAVLMDTIAVGADAFSEGFERALSEAMDVAALARTSRDDVIRVLDAAADDLQWRGKGADAQTWQSLLRPLEAALRPRPATSAIPPVAVAVRTDRRQISRATLHRAAQAVVAVLFVACLIPALPLGTPARVVTLLAALVVFGYLSLSQQQGR
jgi:DnaJ-domain-containing protein 1